MHPNTPAPEGTPEGWNGYLAKSDIVYFDHRTDADGNPLDATYETPNACTGPLPLAAGDVERLMALLRAQPTLDDATAQLLIQMEHYLYPEVTLNTRTP